MIKPKQLPSTILSLLNERLKDEYYAFYLYRYLGNCLQNMGYKLAAKHFHEESEEELCHAKKIEQFIISWNEEPTLFAIKLDCDCEGIPDAVEHAYKTEYELYEKYEETSVNVMDKGDVCVFDFLQYFRDIQVKSVSYYADLINMLEGVNSKDKVSILLMEQKLFG